MSDIGQIIIDHIKEYVDIQLDFYYEDTYSYLFSHNTIPVDTRLVFILRDQRTNDYFILHDGNTIDSNHDTAKIYSFNNEYSYEPLPDVDLSYAYFH
jgi:hypothetical protein